MTPCFLRTMASDDFMQPGRRQPISLGGIFDWVAYGASCGLYSCVSRGGGWGGRRKGEEWG